MEKLKEKPPYKPSDYNVIAQHETEKEIVRYFSSCGIVYEVRVSSGTSNTSYKISYLVVLNTRSKYDNYLKRKNGILYAQKENYLDQKGQWLSIMNRVTSDSCPTGDSVAD